ncbi:winged helix DNA-binding domain-containing protein [Nocardioides sp. SYSU DS0663]|uniref:winged helix DNA-binding domain-containing protein n=1 Tax=Nocardioides sp. SYSU DS0663 TaxID=3416445 RepID=UPI003F4B0A6B
MRHVTDNERRARLAVRHALAPAHRAADAVTATRALTALHATEPATPYLSVRARVDAVTIADLDDALVEDRSLVKQLGMRRTMFAVPRDLLPAVWGSAAARVAPAERAKVAKDAVAAGLASDGEAWVEERCADVLDLLADHPEGLTAAEVRASVPGLTSSQLTGRLLTVLGARARVVRGRNTQHWRVFRPRWTTMEHWLGEPPAPLPPEEGYAELVQRWLWSFGPGTEDDLVWWLGATRTAVRAALAAVGAVGVTLDGGGTGWLHPEDLAEVAAPEPWAALLPVLDATTMGWKGRDWYLGPHAQVLFDRNGNAGTTAWWDGRVVGCWVQDPAGAVEVRTVVDVPPVARRALEAEAARLGAWLAGERVGTVYPSPAMRPER